MTGSPTLDLAVFIRDVPLKLDCESNRLVAAQYFVSRAKPLRHQRPEPRCSVPDRLIAASCLGSTSQNYNVYATAQSRGPSECEGS